MAQAAFGTAGNSTFVDPFKPQAPAPPPPVKTDPVAQSPVKSAPVVPPSTYTGPINNSINNTQQGADLTNANQAQAAKMGITIPGSTQTPATNTPPTSSSGTSTTGTDTSGTSSTGTDTSTTDANQQQLADEQAQRAQADADYQAQSKQVSDTITNIQNGTTPLTTGEQAQIDGLKAQFQVLISAQQLQNTGASGTANIRGYQTGAAEYDPTFQVKTIGAVVAAGQSKIADLDTKMASAVASLTQSFHDNDIAAVTNAWKIYQDAATEHANALQKTIDDTHAAIKSAQDQAAASQAEADKQAQYALDVAKFNQTGDQNSFDNALKSEQEKFNEENQAAIRAQTGATASETARHDKATEAIAAFSAGMGAGGGSNVGISQSAAIGPDGGPDPASQKAVLDQITAKYGPMTAKAIQNLANYTTNPADYGKTAKSGMTHEQAVTLATMYDPTYNEAMYATRAAYMKNIASSQTGTVGAAVNSANKAVNHLTAFVTTMGQLDNSPSKLLNTFNLATLGNVNPEARQAKAAATTEGLGVAEELAKFFKGSGTVDVASIDAWKSQVNTNASPADVKGMTQGAITLLSGQLETLAEQYKSTMGKAPESDFLSPSARASLSSLKNQGYDISIPGIGYTDKNAYLQNGGSPEDLSKAYQRLVSKNDPNNPPTPENVLELAQLQ